MINILLLIGKTASGKNTIIDELVKLGMNRVVAYTTRPMRKSEKDGVEYWFVTEEKFNELEKENFFAETTSYNVASGDLWHYGSPLYEMNEDSVMIVSPEGFDKLKKISALNPISVYIMADIETIWGRLIDRGDNLREAKRRIGADDRDFAGIEDKVDFIFKNNGELKPVLLAEMIKYAYQKTIGDKENG